MVVGIERAGEFIEKYELLRPVAQGGMGSVWAAKLHGPHGFQKLVAMKTVLPELADDREVRARFLDEAQIVSAIVHRNVAQVLDFLEHEGALYIVMEWVEGVSLMWLHERLEARGTQVPTGIALRVLADACAGLHAAHELTNVEGEPFGLVHRDVSPHNMLVSTDGSAKLIDFGVAKSRFRAAGDSSVGQLRGRLAFMSPEQAKSDALDRRADVWSIGASLFYLLTGHGPFGPCGRSDAIRQLVRSGQPLPPPPHVHPAVARVLSGCLARRREDRFATAEEAGWAIEEALEDMGVAASARDVASFVEEQAGDLVGARRFDFGRAGTTGHGPAIPRDLTRLHSGSIASMKQPRRPGVGAIVAACAAIPGIALAFAISSGVHDVRPPAVSPATALVTVDPEPEPTATVEVAPMERVTPPAEIPAAPPPTQATPPHAKSHAVVRRGTWKPRSRHD
jgi:tRNA A-37 threonylcarbamoyl transferase component Bud32